MWSHPKSPGGAELRLLLGCFSWQDPVRVLCHSCAGAASGGRQICPSWAGRGRMPYKTPGELVVMQLLGVDIVSCVRTS